MTLGTNLQKQWEATTTRRLAGWVFSWRTMRRGLIGVGGLATLVGLFYAVENWRGSRAMGQHRKALEAKGETLDMAAMAPAEVPDDQNFAMCPLLKPALDYVHGSHPVQWRDPKGREHLQSINACITHGKRAQAKLGDVRLNTLTDLGSWQAFYRGNTNYPQPQTPGTPAQDVLVGLSRFEADLRILAEASPRPYSRFPLEYDNEDPFSILLPHLAPMKSLATVLGLRVTARLEAGQARAGFEDVRLGLRLADSLSEEPILVSHLVRIATLSVTLQAVKEGLVRHAWTDRELASLQQHLAALDFLAAHKRSMMAERAGMTTALEYYQRKGWPYDPFNLAGDNPEQHELACLFRLMPTGWTRRNELLICRLIEDYPMAAVDEKQHRVDAQRVEGLSEAVCAHRVGPYTFLARLLVPALARACTRTARAQTLVDHAIVACGLERYRLAQGGYPASLAELTPRFVDRIPLDLFDGMPPRYVRNPDGTCLIYSVGWNLKDDGGTIPPHGDDSQVNITEGDWVWHVQGLPNR